MVRFTIEILAVVEKLIFQEKMEETLYGIGHHFLPYDSSNSFLYALFVGAVNTCVISIVGVLLDSNNNIIERYHGTHKDRTKSMRGMKTLKGVQIYNKGFKNYYNFVKPHLSLGMTPAQASGLNVPDNWEEIMKNAFKIKTP